MIEIESAGITDVGRKRQGNEDDYYLDDGIQLYIVADGMGGHQAGEVASRLVVENVRDYVVSFKEADQKEASAYFQKSLSKEANWLLTAVNLANRAVYQVAQSKESYRGMGSTISTVMFTDDTLIVINVGDSPIYLVHNGAIETISVPHTFLAEQAMLDPSANRKLGKEFRHMLTRAMGVEEDVDADISELQCFKGDSLVICSDGLSDKVEPEEINEVVVREKPEDACRILVDMANERGGDDNVTVIVLKVKSVQMTKNVMGKAISYLMNKFLSIIN